MNIQEKQTRSLKLKDNCMEDKRTFQVYENATFVCLETNVEKKSTEDFVGRNT